MRYFLVSDSNSNVLEKKAFSGDDSKADALIVNFLAKNPTFTVDEVDVIAFDSAQIVVVQSTAQKAWAALKASGPTPLQIATFFAKYLGLE